MLMTTNPMMKMLSTLQPIIDPTPTNTPNNPYGTNPPDLNNQPCACNNPDFFQTGQMTLTSNDANVEDSGHQNLPITTAHNKYQLPCPT